MMRWRLVGKRGLSDGGPARHGGLGVLGAGIAAAVVFCSADWCRALPQDGTLSLSIGYFHPSVNAIAVSVSSLSTQQVAITRVLARSSPWCEIALQPGLYYVDCAGMTGADGAGTMVQHRRRSFTISAGGTTGIFLNLGVSILSGTIFVPNPAYAGAGDYLFWDNSDSNAYDVVIATGTATASITVNPNQTAAHQFTAPSPREGYACTLFAAGDRTTPLAVGYVRVTWLWSEAADVGGWKHLSWFGYFADGGSGWIYHLEHGWMYGVGAATSSIWLWSPRLGWLWTSDSAYPFLWSGSLHAWLGYFRGTGNGSGGWFYNWGTGQTEWR